MNEKWAAMATQPKTIEEDSAEVNTIAPIASVTKITKLTKPANVPSWTKDISLETYAKQIVTWTGINEDDPEYAKLKANKHIKGIQKYTAEHIIPVLIN